MNTHTTRRLIGITSVATVAIVLSGCAGATGGGGEGEPITLTFANAEPPAGWQEALDLWNETHDDIQVEQINLPYDQMTSTVTSRVGGNDPGLDLFVLSSGQIPDFVNQGFLTDLSSLRDEALDELLAEDMVEANSYQDKLWALPPWTSEQFLYYNVDVLAQAGVEPPTMDPEERWTWEDIVAASQQVRDSGVDYGFLFDQGQSYYQLQSLAVSAGGGIGMTTEGVPTVDIENAGWQKALSWYHDLYASGISPRGITDDKIQALFQGGKAGFYVGGPWAIPGLAEAGTNFGIAPYPYFEGGEVATPTDSWTIGVSSSTDAPEEAIEFLRWVTLSQEGNEASVGATFIPPTQKDAFPAFGAEMDAKAGDATVGASDLMLYELQNTAVHRPTAIGFTVFDTETYSMFSDIRNGSDPKQRAAEAAQKITSDFERLG